MKIVVLGLNHKTAPVEIREKLAFDAAQTSQAITDLKSRFSDAEFVLISTCNRVELYCAAEDVCSGILTAFLADFHDIQSDKFADYLYSYQNEHAVRHLLTVASSLDSLVIGEAQIIAQVKESYRIACAAKTTGKVLNRLFHAAFAASKKVYTTTSISTGRVSVAGVAVDLAGQLFADIVAAKTLVIGAGEMGQLIVQHLMQAAAKDITIVNRSPERGKEVAERYGIKVKPWDRLNDELIEADIVIASAATQDHLFKKDAFEQIARRRRKSMMLIIDIAVPMNFDPAINDLEDVYLYSVDDLSQVVEQNREARKKDVARGMEVVFEYVADFMNWFGTRDVGPMIGTMKQQFAQIARNEIDRFFVGDRQEASCRDVMETMVNRVVNKLVHCVIQNVNIVARESGPDEAAKLIETIVRQAEEISSEAKNDNKQEDSKS